MSRAYLSGRTRPDVAGTRSRVTVRPTQLGWLPLLGAACLGGLAGITGDSWLLLLAAAFLGVSIGAQILRPQLRDVTVVVSGPERVVVGDIVRSEVHLRNQGRRTLPLTRISHHVDGLADIVVLVDALPPGACAGVTVPRVATARGVATEGVTTLTSTAPLGLVAAGWSVRLPTALVVQPLVHRVAPAPASDGSDGTGAPVRSRSGLDVHGIREWQRGDEARLVHWRSSARRGRLVVLEREAPRGGRLTIAVAGPATVPDWEPLVAAVASLAAATVRTGRAVRMLACDPYDERRRELTTTQETELLDWCAALAAVVPPSPAALTALLRHAGPGEMYVAVTRPARTWWDGAYRSAQAAGVQLVPIVARTEPAPDGGAR